MILILVMGAGFAFCSFAQRSSRVIRALISLSSLFCFSISRLRLPRSVAIPRLSICIAAAPMWTVGILSMPCRL